MWIYTTADHLLFSLPIGITKQKRGITRADRVDIVLSTLKSQGGNRNSIQNKIFEKLR